MGGASATPAIEFQGVSRWYGDGRVKALDNISLTLARGECLAVVGPSGSGKSTLLHLLCGLDRPTSGRVLFEGRAPASVGEWARLRAARIGFVFQAANLLPTLTAAENVEVPMFGQGRGRRERERRASELLERVGLADRAAHRPAELSGGERQRVALARSLANGPDVLLADEPTGNLDSVSAAAVLDLLLGLHAQHGMTLVIVTHNPEVAARAARVVHLFDGRIATDWGGGSP
ncbi:MAG TPA: ABC transporter ATP-binding protein [Planctomycetota bacterium]|nr:ABC transporter ATP-binding protein [Planctomycetota bacterium]HRR80260.1 ABC transporter ATP-binding protein [Planctomycetota bacterium]HRT93368.1 ABC transporter ATP-binding protein [Planctomycetota bacterium]